MSEISEVKSKEIEGVIEALGGVSDGDGSVCVTASVKSEWKSVASQSAKGNKQWQVKQEAKLVN